MTTDELKIRAYEIGQMVKDGLIHSCTYACQLSEHYKCYVKIDADANAFIVEVLLSNEGWYIDELRRKARDSNAPNYIIDDLDNRRQSISLVVLWSDDMDDDLVWTPDHEDGIFGAPCFTRHKPGQYVTSLNATERKIMDVVFDSIESYCSDIKSEDTKETFNAANDEIPYYRFVGNQHCWDTTFLPADYQPDYDIINCQKLTDLKLLKEEEPHIILQIHIGYIERYNPEYFGQVTRTYGLLAVDEDTRQTIAIINMPDHSPEYVYDALRILSKTLLEKDLRPYVIKVSTDYTYYYLLNFAQRLDCQLLKVDQLHALAVAYDEVVLNYENLDDEDKSLYLLDEQTREYIADVYADIMTWNQERLEAMPKRFFEILDAISPAHYDVRKVSHIVHELTDLLQCKSSYLIEVSDEKSQHRAQLLVTAATTLEALADFIIDVFHLSPETIYRFDFFPTNRSWQNDVYFRPDHAGWEELSARSVTLMRLNLDYCHNSFLFSDPDHQMLCELIEERYGLSDPTVIKEVDPNVF